jgi:hypothetical protein
MKKIALITASLALLATPVLAEEAKTVGGFNRCQPVPEWPSQAGRQLPWRPESVRREARNSWLRTVTSVISYGKTRRVETAGFPTHYFSQALKRQSAIAPNIAVEG